MKKNKMKEFKKNLEKEKFSSEFIQKALQYFAELEKEKKVEKFDSVEEIIDHNAKSFTFTWNASKSEENLKEFREDLYLLYLKDSNNLLDFNEYFENIEMFEIYVLYVLYFEFYPKEEEC